MATELRHNWTEKELGKVYDLPLIELLYQAHSLHREFFNPLEIQPSTLMNIKTGGCAEDCKYCSQSAHFETGLKAGKLSPVEEVKEQARAAKEAGATRFCMGAAWRSPKERDMPMLVEMIQEVKTLGLESCMTLGMITENQAQELSSAGLDFYNHNIDTSEENYSNIITTRSFQDRLDTLENVRQSGMKVCCGGILGMGESKEDRLSMLKTLANQPSHPESVPINMLVPIKGTPLGDVKPLHAIELIRTIATARMAMPQSYLRLSAGRTNLSEAEQLICFFAGANSIFFGEELLTTPNPSENQDKAMLEAMGMVFQKVA